MKKKAFLAAAMAATMAVSLSGCSLANGFAQILESQTPASSQSEQAEETPAPTPNEADTGTDVDTQPEDNQNKPSTEGENPFSSVLDEDLAVSADVDQETFVSSLTNENLDDIAFVGANLERFRVMPSDAVDEMESNGVFVRDKITNLLNSFGNVVDLGYDDVRCYFGYTELLSSGEYLLVPVPMPVFEGSEVETEDYMTGVLQLNTLGADISVSYGSNINSDTPLQDQLNVINELDEASDEYYTISSMNDAGTAFWSETYSQDYDSVVGNLRYVVDYGDVSAVCDIDYSYDSAPDTPRNEQMSQAFMDMLAVFDLEPSSTFAGSTL